MKSFIALLSAAMLALTLTACGESAQEQKAKAEAVAKEAAAKAEAAAKEAAAKALGTGFAQGVAFHTLEILSNAAGRPALTLHGPALARAEVLGATSWHVSISHIRDTAAAVVVLEG